MATAQPGTPRTRAADTGRGNAEDRANCCSKLFFCYLNPLLSRGNKAALEPEDLEPMKVSEQATAIAAEFERAWEAGKNDPMRSIKGIMWKWQKSELSWSMLLAFFVAIGPITPPFVLQYFIPWMYGRDQPTSPFIPHKPLWWGIVYILLIALVPMLTTFMEAIATRLLTHVGIVARIAANSAVYRKSLKLSAKAKAQSTTGQIVNLMSTDAERLFQFPVLILNLIALPIQIIVCLVLLFYNIGVSTFGGLIAGIILMPFTAVIGGTFKMAIGDKLKYADQRLKLMNELLAGMKVVKLNCYEVPLVERINEVRMLEVDAIRRVRKGFAQFMFIVSIAPSVIFLGALGLHIALGKPLDVEIIFVSNSLFEVLRIPLSVTAFLIINAVTTLASSRRLEKFLNLEEIPALNETKDMPIGGLSVSGSFAWAEREEEKPPEMDAKTKAKVEAAAKKKADAEAKKAAAEKKKGGKGGAAIEMGDVAAASGGADAAKPAVKKSAIEEAAEEAARQKAEADKKKAEEEKAKKREVTLTDMKLDVKPGSLTMIVGPVGSGKSSLIGAILGNIPSHNGTGKAALRGKLAYVPQGAWIINATLKDNILFGKPYDEKKYQETIRVCALKSDLDMLPAGDMTEIGERGINVSGGQKQRISIARAVYADADIYLFDDPLSAVDAHVGKTLFEECINGVLKGRTRILATNQLVVVPDADDIIFLSSDGKVAEHGNFQQLIKNKSGFEAMYTENMGKHAEKEAEAEGAGGAKKEEAGAVKTNVAGAGAQLVHDEDRSSGKVSWAVYGQYCKALGGVPFGIIWVTLTLVQIGIQVLGSFELAYLADGTLNSKLGSSWSINTQVGVYALILVAYGISVWAQQFYYAPAATRTSKVIHAALLKRVVRAPMSFFDMTPLGRVVNRFAKDTDSIDMELPSQFSSFCNMSLAFIGIITTLGVSAPWFLVSVVPIALIYGYIMNYYRHSSLELQRLDSVSRSPIFAHFSEALDGADSIRAYKLSERFDALNSKKLDTNHEAYINVQIANLWLKVRLAMLGSLVVLVVGFVVVFTRDDGSLNVGLATLAVTQSFSVTVSLNFYVLVSTRLEQQMNSVDREYEYIRMANEAAPVIEGKRPPAKWPADGAVEFKNVNMKYRPDLDDVLKNVSFTVRGGEKIGFVGRSGSGKSSLMVALFRLVEIGSGSISIDGQNLKDFGTDDVRKKIAIIPQDPVLFVGSIRDNIDPFHERTPEELDRAIDIAVLRETIDALPKGLDTIVAEGGSNFSVGQRQLFCLARAVCRKSKILVLDEATASVDADTDRKIQIAVRDHFRDCTTLTIAHRLNTIMDCDRIVVMDKGTVGEYDTPRNLLKNPKGHLSALVENTGPATAAHLRRIAFGEAEAVDRVETPKAGGVSTPKSGAGISTPTGKRDSTAFPPVLAGGDSTKSSPKLGTSGVGSVKASPRASGSDAAPAAVTASPSAQPPEKGKAPAGAHHHAHSRHHQASSQPAAPTTASPARAAGRPRSGSQSSEFSYSYSSSMEKDRV